MIDPDISAAYDAIEHNSLDRRRAAAVRFIGHVIRRIPPNERDLEREMSETELRPRLLTHFIGGR
ncbi:hypothetical protein, partial [Burkholderia ubonensis]|uniref:hypothetical protein n=1 Tax=Burkholderia ubonensis TaxID=101571 RepID=UPI001C42F19F